MIRFFTLTLTTCLLANGCWSKELEPDFLHPAKMHHYPPPLSFSALEAAPFVTIVNPSSDSQPHHHHFFHLLPHLPSIGHNFTPSPEEIFENIKQKHGETVAEKTLKLKNYNVNAVNRVLPLIEKYGESMVDAVREHCPTAVRKIESAFQKEITTPSDFSKKKVSFANLVTAIKKYSPEIQQTIVNYGPMVIDLIEKHTPEAVLAVSKIISGHDTTPIASMKESATTVPSYHPIIGKIEKIEGFFKKNTTIPSDFSKKKISFSDFVTVIKKYGPDVQQIVVQYGPEVISLIEKYGPEVIQTIEKVTRNT